MNVGQRFAVLLLRGYKLTLSPVLSLLFGPYAGCRFEPTCSVYALEAIKAHGVLYGSWLALRRVARCHPWGGAGCDPVPPPRSERCACHGAPGEPQHCHCGETGTVKVGRDISCPQRC